MITYGFSIQGKSHVEKGVVCQDSNIVERLQCGLYFAVVADGVGSAAHSDIGSSLAVRSLYNYCNHTIKADMTAEQIQEVLYNGYEYAYKQIETYSAEKEMVIDDFDTTLSSVIYDGVTVIYGHAGDGGIMARFYDGRYKPLTERQKGADGVSVRPLRAGSDSWEFGIVNGKVSGLLLVTDGMLDGVIQPVLVNLPDDRMALAKGNFKKDNVYVTATEFFMNPYAVYLNKNIQNPDDYMKHFIEGELKSEDQTSFISCMYYGYAKRMGKTEALEICNGIKKYYYAVWAMKNVTDDKSVACIINEKAPEESQGVDYYKEPNWKWRQERYTALLYGQPLPSQPEDETESDIQRDAVTGTKRKEEMSLKKDEPKEKSYIQKDKEMQVDFEDDSLPVYQQRATQAYRKSLEYQKKDKKIRFIAGIFAVVVTVFVLSSGIILINSNRKNKDLEEQETSDIAGRLSTEKKDFGTERAKEEKITEKTEEDVGQSMPEQDAACFMQAMISAEWNSENDEEINDSYETAKDNLEELKQTVRKIREDRAEDKTATTEIISGNLKKSEREDIDELGSESSSEESAGMDLERKTEDQRIADEDNENDSENIIKDIIGKLLDETYSDHAFDLFWKYCQDNVADWRATEDLTPREKKIRFQMIIDITKQQIENLENGDAIYNSEPLDIEES